jgi:hypothetical protein
MQAQMEKAKIYSYQIPDICEFMTQLYCMREPLKREGLLACPLKTPLQRTWICLRQGKLWWALQGVWDKGKVEFVSHFN